MGRFLPLSLSLAGALSFLAAAPAQAAPDPSPRSLAVSMQGVKGQPNRPGNARSTAATPRAGRSPAPALPAPPPSAVAAWAGPSGCVTFSDARRLRGRVGQGDAQALIANFERNYPTAWRTKRGLKGVTLSPAQLREIVTGLACLSTWPAADPMLPRTALALFRHDRFGRMAFDQLDGVARDATVPAPVRAAARAFHADMSFRVEAKG